MNNPKRHSSYGRKNETEENRAREMYKLFQKGMTYTKIGKMYGISAQAVSDTVMKWVFRGG